MHDLRQAFRQLFKSPAFTLISIVALALGIGANTAIFSVVYGVLLRPLPYPEQEKLVFVSEWSEQVPNMAVSYPNYVDFRTRQKSLSALGASRNQGYNLVGASEIERITGAQASADTFVALGVSPLRGRFYTSDEDKVGAERTVMLSERLWRRSFGARDSVIGEKVNLSGNPYTIVGVMPAIFQFPQNTTDLWVPLGLYADQYNQRGSHPGINCVGRLKPGVTYEQAAADLKAIATSLATEYPSSNARQSASLQPFTERAFGEVRPTLLILLAAAGCVLLIACANVANLQLARAQGRSREFAVRAALGAGRGRVIRQLLVESLALGACGCIAGILVGYWGLDALKSVLPSNIPRIAGVGLNGWVLGFAILVSLATSVVFGLVPALHAAKQDLRETLSAGTRGSTSGGQRWRSALIIGEFALTSVLLVGAGLMIRTMFNLYRADPGYTTDQLITFNWILPGKPFAEAKPRLVKLEAALEKLRALPGAKSVSLINPLPLSGNSNQNSYLAEQNPDLGPGRNPSTEVFAISGDAFETLDIRLLAGRTFGPEDRDNTRKVAVVDTMFVQKNFGGTPAQAIGKRFGFGGHATKAEDWFEIVGVVEHIQNYGLGKTTREQCYTPYTQDPPSGPTFIVRTQQNPASVGQSLRTAMKEVASDLPIFGVRTMSEYFDQSVGTQRLTVLLLGAFAALALLLASVGLYGVLNYSVSQRTREIGVRMALGALPGAVVKLVITQGAKLAGLGLAVGLIGSLAATHLLSRVLYEVSPFDPLSFGLVTVVLSLVGLFACWLPAKRATKIDPIVALRTE